MSVVDVSDTDQPIEEFLERMRPRLRILFSRFRIPVQDTEDILQQSLLALLYQWDSVRNPEAWLLGTLRKTCQRYWRDHRRRLYEAVDTAILEWLADPNPPQQEKDELRHDLETLLARLPPRCQALLLMRYRDGLDAPEIAGRLGYRPSSIGKVTARCLAAMTREMVAAGLCRDKLDGGRS